MEFENKLTGSGQDFLLVEHEQVGFLINRDQFFASVYLEEIEPFSGDGLCPEYCAGTMVFRNEKIAVFELDNKLRDLFDAEPRKGLKIALISDLSGFGADTGKIFREMIGNADPEASLDLIAFRIGSQAGIRRIDLEEIKLIPGRMRRNMTEKGILGCRFEGLLDIYFFIDIETVSLGVDENAG